jgi:primosomal protein N' (replication factor Y)
MTHLEVAVAAPLNRTLTYSLPVDSICQSVKEEQCRWIGKRVLVSLSGRRVTGYVLSSMNEEKTEFAVKNIIKFLDERPIFHENQISFFRWVADYYHYPIGLVIKTALPQGLAPRSVKKLVLSRNHGRLTTLCDVEHQSWVDKILEKGELGVSETRKIVGKAETEKQIKKLIKDDVLRIEESVQEDGKREKREVCYSLVSSLKNSDHGQVASHLDFNTCRKKYSEQFGVQLKLSETKAIYHLNAICQRTRLKKISLKDLKKEYSGAAKALAQLESKKLVLRSTNRVYRSPFGEQLNFYPRPEHLTAEQTAALSEITEALSSEKFCPFLLHGVTGCGKTEIYLRAAEITLSAGRDVLILVPEIALATQLEAHLVSRFGDLVVLQHSSLTKVQRFDQYDMALRGRAKVVVGARSALFAPLRDPGLIVVDEEHDAGFKQDDNFRYHGRDLSVVRAKFHDAVLILGSATPSVTSYANAISGKYRLLKLTKRIGERSLPTVKVIDLNKDKPKKSSTIIRTVLRDRLKKNLKNGSQSLLLLNRRGFSSALLCQDCGTPVQCTHCNVSLTLHKKTERLLCHYCGFSISSNTVCFECRSTSLLPAGYGIERVEEEVRVLFPDARLRRMDSDTTADRKKFLKILKEMHEGEIDILIGTQMIAKGHHFPNVTLVGVVWADGGISMPDFRAAEKTFQLITQVTGRAGRGEKPGEVIIQTLRPDHYAIVYAKKHQYQEMYEHEMRARVSPSFPPYVRLTAIRIQGRVERDVQENSLKIGRFLRKCAAQRKYTVTVLGPAPSPLDKIKDKYRWQLLLKGTSDELNKICIDLDLQKSALVVRQCKVIIDVDPENMM